MPTQISPPRWLSEKEVANITGLSLSTLRAHRFYRKGINYSKIGRAVRYSEQDVQDFMQACRIDVSSAQ